MNDRIFISYRRDDTKHFANLLHYRLADEFGKDRIYMDIDLTAPGEDFEQKINDAIGRSGVVLAVIGEQWLEAEKAGKPRSADTRDWVHMEIEQAIEQGVQIIPILVDDATMPGEADVPAGIRKLVTRQALKIEHTSFAADADHLIARLNQIFADLAQREEEEKERKRAARIGELEVEKEKTQKTFEQIDHELARLKAEDASAHAAAPANVQSPEVPSGAGATAQPFLRRHTHISGALLGLVAGFVILFLGISLFKFLGVFDTEPDFNIVDVTGVSLLFGAVPGLVTGAVCGTSWTLARLALAGAAIAFVLHVIVVVDGDQSFRWGAGLAFTAPFGALIVSIVGRIVVWRRHRKRSAADQSG